MKKILATLSLTALAACGQSPRTTSATKDVGSGKPLVSCQGNSPRDGEISFQIRRTAVPTYIQGVLTFGDALQPIDLKCKRAPRSHAIGADLPQALWSCTEARGGDGRYLVSVHTQGFSAMELADVSIEQIFPLKPKKLATLVCEE